MTYYRSLEEQYPFTLLGAGGEAVGLPPGQQGNSEVGHLNLGCGRVVLQSTTRIDRAIETGDFEDNPALLGALAHVKRTGGTLHLLGLVSDGGVHSSLRHLEAAIVAAAGARVPIEIAAFLDGRDTPPRSAKTYLARVEAKCQEYGNASISMICGRYYAMDRDGRWERTQRAYDALVYGRARSAPTAAAGVDAAYARGEDDEFVAPTIVGPLAPIVKDGDACFFFNFRPDRARQLTRAFCDPAFDAFPVKRFADFTFIIMTRYDEAFDNPVMFGRVFETSTLGEIVSGAGLEQLRLAETEKYAHVTYFFSGGREEPFGLERRVLVPSAKEVGTYDKKPEMRAREITDAALEALASGRYALIVMNYANADMVGHTGKWPAILQALDVLDECLRRLVPAVLAAGGTLVLTADHGNAEEKIDRRTGGELTAHTANPVPLLLVRDGSPGALREGGRLADVAPTVCRLLGLTQPAAMTGRSLLIS